MSENKNKNKNTMIKMVEIQTLTLSNVKEFVEQPELDSLLVAL